MATAAVPTFAPLPGDIDASICIIGAGIAGLTTAYLLAREGRRAVVIDAAGIGAGETGRTTAHLFPPDAWYARIQESFGPDKTRMIYRSFADAVDVVEAIVANEAIDCDFERLDGYLYARPENEFKELGREYDAAHRAGADVELLAHVPGLSFDTGPCVRYRHQAQFHPLKYLAGLAAAVVRRGGTIYCGTRALDIERDDGTRVVITDCGTIRANHVVVATNTPFNNRVVMHTKQAGYRTYVIAMRVPRGSVPRILLWDTGDPYYYVRSMTPDADADHDYLIVGGEDHKSGQDAHPEHRWAQIERWTRERFPMALDTGYRWSGEVMEPADGVAFLGRNPLDDRNVFVITGDSGNGMTHCTIGAIIVADMIAGRDNPWAAVYDPSRKVLHGIQEFVSEQANTLAQYGDWLKSGEVDSVDEIGAGQGAVVRDGARKLAVYRDEGGELHALSAKCTHLGCVVRWNSAERSWDCPCHGSRFGVGGAVLHGPAATPLESVALGPRGSAPSAPGARRPGKRTGLP